MGQIVSGEPSELHDQTCEWGHAHTAPSQSVSICPSYDSFCGRNQSESPLGQAAYLVRYYNMTENQKTIQRTARQRVGFSRQEGASTKRRNGAVCAEETESAQGVQRSCDIPNRYQGYTLSMFNDCTPVINHALCTIVS